MQHRHLLAFGFVLTVDWQGTAMAVEVPSDPFNQTRTATFTYLPNGSLGTATVEPTKPQSCATTTLTFDANGNPDSASTANCAGASGNAVFATRSGVTQFPAVPSQPITVNGSNVNVSIPAGLFPGLRTNGLGQQVSTTFDPRFGVALTLKDENQVTRSVVLDDFGRLVQVIAPDQTRTVFKYCLLASSDSDFSANSASCPTPSAAERPADAASFIQGEEQDTTGAKSGALSRVYFDKLGRVVRRVTEGFDGTSQPASLKGALVVQDVVYGHVGEQLLATAPYYLSTGASVTGETNKVGVVLSEYDTLGRVRKSYRADANGQGSATFGGSVGVSYGSYGTSRAAVTAYTYQGQKVSVKNDQQQVTAVDRDARGQTRVMTDPSGAQTAYNYDALGNVLTVKDPLQNKTDIAYSVSGWRVSMNDPDKGLWKYDYNALGETVWSQSPKQRLSSLATAYGYDVLGRVTQRSNEDFVTSWYYDKYKDNSACLGGIGKLCQVTTTIDEDQRYFYDALGRPIAERLDLSNSSLQFASSVSYNATTGRVDSTVYPTGVQVSLAYTPLGFPSSLNLKTPVTVKPLPDAQGVKASTLALVANTKLWEAKTVNALGVVEQNQLSSSILEKSAFDPLAGDLIGQTAGLSGSTAVFNQSYTRDSLGNLTSRVDANGAGNGRAVSETFDYGTGPTSLNQLTHYAVSGPDVPDLSRDVFLQYNAAGALLSKSDVGYYNYPANGANSVAPHLVRSISGGVVTSYVPDEQGNIKSSTGSHYSTLTYTSFDRVASMSASGANGAVQYNWNYDSNHFRLKQREVTASGTYAGTRTTYYRHPDAAGGLGFEHEDNAPTVPSAANPRVKSSRHFLSIGGVPIGLLVTTGSLPTLSSGQQGPTALTANVDAVKLEFWHTDFLGSVATTSDHLGNVTARLSYDPFGKRRAPSGAYDRTDVVNSDWNPALNFGTGRGYTGHEHLDEAGVINMNGRLYDPKIGSFMQADAFAGLYEPLGMNRYSYVRNNPFSATDPSGFIPDPTPPQIEVPGKRLNGGIDDLRWPGGWTQITSAGWNYLDQIYRDFPSGMPLGNGGSGTPRSQSWKSNPLDDGSERGRSPALPPARLMLAVNEYGGDMDAAIARYQACGASMSCISTARSDMIRLREGLRATGNPIQDRLGLNANIGQASIILGDYGEVLRAVGNVGVATLPDQAWGGRAHGLRLPGRGAPKGHQSNDGPNAAACGCCFVAGTLVSTESGLTPIEDIRVGTLVLARDELGGTTAMKPVTDVLRNDGRRIHAVIVLTNATKVDRIEASEDHPFWVIRRGWTAASMLQRGMKIATLEGGEALIVNVEDLGQERPTFNLTVDDFHTFFVGESALLVHNATKECCSRIVKNSAGQSRVRKLVKDQDELLAAAERAAGGRLDTYKNWKPDWWISPDGKRKIEWNPAGHHNTNEGPHVTVRDYDEATGGWPVTEKYFIEGQEKWR